MKVPNMLMWQGPEVVSLSRLQNEGSQQTHAAGVIVVKSIKATE